MYLVFFTQGVILVWNKLVGAVISHMLWWFKSVLSADNFIVDKT